MNEVYVLSTWSDDRKHYEVLLWKLSVLEDKLEAIYRLHTDSSYEYKDTAKRLALQGLQAARADVTQKVIGVKHE